jgi:hypothetical protein
MRNRLTFAICALAVLATAAVAHAAGPVPVAIFSFTDPGEANSFTKVAGGKCAKKIRPAIALGINVKDTSPVCAFRTSVVAASDDTSPSQELQASVSYEQKTPPKLAKKLYLSVLTRASGTGHYELRLVPVKKRWLLIRDPEGTAPAAILASGTLNSIKPKPTKPNSILLRTFAGLGGAIAVTAQVNGLNVYNASDVAPSPPSGKFNEIALGNKAGASAMGMMGTFDNVTVRVPNPF